MLKFLMSKNVIKAVSQVVSSIFNRARKRFLNEEFGPKGIRISATVDRPAEHRLDLSLKGIFDAAAKAEGMPPNKKLYESVESGVKDYLEAHEKLATARVLNAVQSYLHNADLGSSTADPDKELGQVLEETFGKVSSDVASVVDSESNKAKNISTLDAISKISLSLGIDDPTIYFAGPLDAHTCKECIRMFFLTDLVTPRVWKTSELKAGYFKRGDEYPCIAGGHNHCRHGLCSILPGYGFKSGILEYIEPGYDVYAEQHK
jgi:hypothetical protein